MSRKIKVLIAKPGLDGHDRGAKLISKALRDAGMEVIYTGYGQTPAQVVAAALQEDVDVIGASYLCGAHLELTQKIIAGLREKNITDKLVLVGGTIPKEDIPLLKQMGVAEVFPTGTPAREVVEFIQRRVAARH
jgi:methylmalonyl-CoA mutase C-terminal domain/subunit